MSAPIVEIEVSSPPMATDSELSGSSLLLTSITQHPDRLMLVNGDSSVEANDSLEKRFVGVTACGDRFHLELGAVLPDRLPGPPGKLDYSIDLSDPRSAGPEKLCFSDQMLILRFTDEGNPHHILAPIYRLQNISSETARRIPECAHYEALKTVVTARFDLPGRMIGPAIRANLQDCVGLFIDAINRVADAHLLTPSSMRTMLWPRYARNSFPHIYIAAIGDSDSIQCHRYITNLFQLPLHEINYDQEHWEAFQAQLARAQDHSEPRLLLGSARSHLLRGEERFALLEMAMAVEIAASRFVDAELRRAGVSSSKLKDHSGDMNFGLILNVLVPSIIVGAEEVTDSLLGEINRIRKVRNKLIHESAFTAEKVELLALLSSASDFLDLLEAKGGPGREVG